VKTIILAIYRDHIFDKDRPLALIKVCGVSLILRILNSIRAAELREVLIILGFEGGQISNRLENGEEIGMKIRYLRAEGHEVPEIPQDFLNDDSLIISTGIVMDAEFASEIVNMKGNVVCYSNDEPVGVYKLSKEYLKSLHSDEARNRLDKLLEIMENSQGLKLDISKMQREHVELKRKISPICVKIEDKKSIEMARKKLIFGTQKGLHFTSYINKPIEDRIIYHLADMSWITPNRITIFANLVAFFVAVLFLVGSLWIAGILACVVGIIDGLDGKLARARGTLTKLGHIEHTFDMLYEQVWYVSFAISLYLLGYGYLPLVLGLFTLVTDSFVRHCYMQFRQTMGKALTAYTRFDKAFAKIDGRRNVYVLYMILFSGLPWLQTPLYALYAMLLHSSFTALIYAIRAIQHMSAADKADGTKRFLKLVGKP